MPTLLVILRYVTAIVATAICLQAAAWAGVVTPFQPAGVAFRQGRDSSGLLSIASRGKAARQARMRRCMQSWDPATQMSKHEWKDTCRRVIIQQPGMFGPDPL
jgi:hypothetical protein